MQKKKKMWLAVVAVLELIVLLLVAAYAWIEGINKPKIEGQQMSISTANGLLMRLNGDVKNTIDLNVYLGANSDAFLLKEASSPDGITVFLRDGTKERLENANTASGDIRLTQASSYDDANKRYLDIPFELVAEGAERDVWLAEDECSLALVQREGATEILPSDALRMSLTFKTYAVADQPDVKPIEKTYVFATNPTKSMASTNKPISAVNPDTGLILSRVTYDTTTATTADASDDSTDTTSQTLHLYSFSDFYENQNTLIHLVKDQQCSVTLRVWLEGTDDACIDDIAGNTFNLSLMFDSTPDTESTDTTTPAA